MLSNEFIANRLSQDVLNISPLQGGDINDTFLIQTPDRQYVLKRNKKTRFPQMFEKEAKGLNKLSLNGVISPQVIKIFEHDEDQFLILAHIQSEGPQHQFWKNFGQALSNLHLNSQEYFGLEYPNYIGSLVQLNDNKISWETFFVENRIQPLVQKAFDRQLLSKKHLGWFDGFSTAFPNLVPNEKPALIHGDLWSGNLMCGIDQTPVFIDPAIYYGHREMDIAMTKMFGGFDRAFLDAYNEIFPMEKGWEKRMSIHNLYPNLVHLNLFGTSYLRGIESVIKTFGS